VIASGVPALPYDDPAGYTAPAAFGPFRVLHQIGSGALGPVFRAFASTDERVIAIKAFRLDIVPEATARLADALRTLAATPVAHPHIIATVSAGLEGHTAYLASEYVAGQSLDQVIRAEAPASLAQVLERLRPVADAIDAAWRQGIGHGAFHPRDVIITTEGTARVGGFGVVQACERALVKVPLRRPYAAPERLAGRSWDQRADVYALGVVAHEMLTGRRPAGPGEQDGALATSTTPEERVTLRRALSAALAVDPSARFATATAFVEALAGGAVPDAAPVPVAQSLFDLEEGEQVLQVQQVLRVLQVQQVLRVPQVLQVPQVQQVPPVLEVPLVPPASAVPPVVRREVMPFEHYRPVQVPVVDTTGGSRSFLVVGLLLGLIGGALLGVWWQGARQAPSTPVTAQEEAQDTPGTEVPVADVTTPSSPAQAPSPAVDGAPTRGRLLVRTTPAGATVRVNGRVRGTSPATVRDLPFGTYNVTVSRPGHQTRSQRVTVSRRVPARDITIELRPAAAPASAAPSSVAATGSVYVETRPAGAQVTIDGTLRGTAPLRVPELSPGTHTIRLDLAGHRSVTTTVVVRAGQQVSVRVSLEVQ
jgi:hypothetical protein